jgi:hypothetical protein
MAFWCEIGRIPHMTYPVCALCGMSVVRLPVDEDHRRFHLDCYMTYQRHRAIPPPQPQPSVAP